MRDRERLRFERTRIFGRARRLFRRVGEELVRSGQIASREDVFFLTVQEVLGFVEGSGVSADLSGLVEVRRREREREEARPSPPSRLEIRGPVRAFRPPAAIERIGSALETAPETTRRGTGCSAGIYEGRVRVVLDPRGDVLEDGEILVARHTDPGWIALFGNARAIVVERGSLLSHSAIVAREFGIPCVVGVPRATTWLRTGDRVRVDGATGEIVRLDDTAL